MRERLTPRRALSAGGWGAAIVLAALVPYLVTDPTWQNVAVQVLANAIVVLGLSLLFGYAGQMSFAQATFVGFGSYAPAILFVEFGLSPWWGLPAGILSAMAVAWAVGIPVLRLEGYYLAMATAAVAIGFVIVAEQLSSVTGGPYGLAGLAALDLFGNELITPQDLYPVVLAGFLLSALLVRRLVRSPSGRLLSAVRDDPRAAGLCGLNVARVKLQTFVASAGLAAVGGFFLVQSLLVVNPGQFGIVPALYFVIMLVVGGSRSVIGAVLGALFVTATPELLAGHVEAQEIVFAVTFLLVVLFLPNGIAGAFRSLAHLVHARVARLHPGRPIAGRKSA